MIIDLRSDTVTQPTAAMRKAMHDAEVGDDVHGDDPTVNRLEAMAAERLGHEAGLFMPSGTQSNLVALLTHCGRGDEYICGHDAHTYRYEGGGAAVFGGIQPQPVPFGDDGGLPLDAVASVIKDRADTHFAKTRLLCLENTQHGRVQSLESLREARAFAHAHALAIHLDGARAANAAVVLGVSLEDIGRCFDSVSLCLSKGLGAPVGSMLVGSTEFIAAARRWRKVAGGGMRQAGVLAAAGIIALEEGPAALADDHAKARELATALEPLPGISLRPGWLQSNMVWLSLPEDKVTGVLAAAAEAGLRLSLSRQGWSRIVLHRDIPSGALPTIVEVFARGLDT
ncbi:MAG: low-specificity L-threonine aldolase [Gammaproteobacteria bacterium]|nr:MAG: low-specificity L-threonine aldolase [Gammaproteobacteria bacterium]PIE36892.1 MAG: low-specificity L-threonine aldolase [Gammaproteobacteria bacterium]